MTFTAQEVLGVILLADLAIYRFREAIAEFWATHFPHSDSESLPDLSDLRKWRKD